MNQVAVIPTDDLQRFARRALDSNLKIKDRVSIAIQSYGSSEPRFSVDDLIGKTRLSGTQIYSALHSLEDNGEIEIVTERISKGAGKRITGVKLKKLPSIEAINEAARVKASPMIEKIVVKRRTPLPPLDTPLLEAYQKKKVAVDTARDLLAEAGVDSVIEFATEPVAEESIALLHALSLERAETENMMERLSTALGELAVIRRRYGIVGSTTIDIETTPEPLDLIDDREAEASQV